MSLPALVNMHVGAWSTADQTASVDHNRCDIVADLNLERHCVAFPIMNMIHLTAASMKVKK